MKTAADANRSSSVVFARIWSVVQGAIGLSCLYFGLAGKAGLDVVRIPLLVAGIPPLIVAMGVWRLRRWSLWLGLAHSALLPLTLILTILLTRAVFPESDSSGYGPGGPGMGMGGAIDFVISVSVVILYWGINLLGFAMLLSVRSLRVSGPRSDKSN